MALRHIFFTILLTLGLVSSALAGDKPRPVAEFDLKFPGPFGGYTFVSIPTQVITKFGDTVAVEKTWLIDLGSSNDGTYIEADTFQVATELRDFIFPIRKGFALYAKLAPTRGRDQFKKLDSNFTGVLGNSFLRRYVAEFDYKANKLRLYTPGGAFEIEDSKKVLPLKLLDDARLTYCHCAFPTIWLDAEASPFKPGRVHLALAEPLSQIYWPAVDGITKAQLKDEREKDSIAGNKTFIGISIPSFKLEGKEIARRSPKRGVTDVPALFKDLDIPILGTIGNDLLRTFSSLVIDPVKNKVYLTTD